MSGIYIKGMEMPKDIEPGLVIEFANGIDGKRYARLYHYQHGGLTEWLEIVPVPPHGRCIDADSIRNLMVSSLLDPDVTSPTIRGLMKTIISTIDSFPTIIPAEKCKT